MLIIFNFVFYRLYDDCQKKWYEIKIIIFNKIKL